MKKDPVYQKLLEHDKHFKAHDKKFDQIDKRFDAVDKRFDTVELRLDHNDEVHKKLIKKLFDHDDEFVRVHDEIRDLRNDMNTRSDEMLTILKRLDEERIASYSRFDRIEKEQNIHKIKLAEHDKSIITLKTKLKVA